LEISLQHHQATVRALGNKANGQMVSITLLIQIKMFGLYIVKMTGIGVIGINKILTVMMMAHGRRIQRSRGLLKRS